MRQQGSQKLPTHYVLINHVQNPNRDNNQKNFQTVGRAETSTSRANMISSWNELRLFSALSCAVSNLCSELSLKY
jgi:hypothetical protein